MRDLGELETAVMDILWRSPTPCRAREVLEQLAPRKVLAYTTVMTVLSNLHRKGWVRRDLDNRAYRYWPAASREEFTSRALRELLDSSDDAEAVLIHFLRSVTDAESAVLRRALAERPPTSEADPAVGCG